MMKKGYSRFVLLIGAYAIKLPRLASMRQFACGLLSNISETENYNEDQPLAPILFGCGLVVVMRRATPVGDELNIPDELKELTGYDCKKSSFGILNGTIVAVDYHRNIHE